MKPKKKDFPLEEYLYPPLVNIIDMNHPLVKLADAIDWSKLEEIFGSLYHEKKGRPGISIRLMIGLHYLKYTYNMSDVEVLNRWLENPYWQYFTGEKVFQKELPIDSSSMTKFRKRLKEKELDELLSETIRVGFSEGYLKKEDISEVAVDTTVQEKEIKYPTDIQLYYDFIVLLNRYRKQKGMKLKNSYEKSCKKLLRKYSGYIHAKQFKRAAKVLKRVRTRSLRLYREIEKRLLDYEKSEEEFLKLKDYYESLKERKRSSKNKLYSLWAPEVECISKGKLHKRYEFGVKTGIVSSLSKGFVFSCKVFSGNPYDGHTLSDNLSDAEERLRFFGKIRRAFVDLGYRKHDYEGEVDVVVVPKNLQRFDDLLKRKMKRRSVIEAVISHMKRMCRFDKNKLHGRMGDKINAVFSAIGHNLRLLLAFFSFVLFFGAEKDGVLSFYRILLVIVTTIVEFKTVCL
ncbi:IS5 family transposase [Deferribacter abyssi]|uniref:IS5 family transposase n=1 Tax=Deferribacter abyssi TaxID=213806 RepID=UPI003C285F60